MTRTDTHRPSATQVIFEKETCGRCGGSGQYSYNQIDGSRCFGCGGSGERLSKRGKAAKKFADDMLEVAIEDLPQGRRATYRNSWTGHKTTFSGTRITGYTKSKSTRDTEWREIPDFALLLKQSDGTMKEASTIISAGIRVRMIPTEEEIEQIAQYQDNLTKAGKPKKQKSWR